MKELKQELEECDDKIIALLKSRMDITEKIIQYKRKYRIPILELEEEKIKKEKIKKNLITYSYQKEILDIFKNIITNSKKVQTENLFSYNIMLIGFMGVGKSTISDYLRKALAMEEIDIDSFIEKKEGISIEKIFEQYGENYFRDCETNILRELKKRTNIIISCGGGIVLREENLRYMKEQGKVVLLTASPKTIFERVKDTTQRPILNNNMNIEYIADLMEQRREKYEKAADIIISVEHKTIAKICEELIEKLSFREII